MQCAKTKDGVSFGVRVVPRASHSEIVGAHDGSLRVRLAAPPVDGAANEELIRVLARTLHVPRARIEIVAGHTNRTKQVRVAGVSCASVARLCVKVARLFEVDLLRRK